DLRAQRGGEVVGRDRVGVLGGAGDVGEAAAGVALPLVGVDVVGAGPGARVGGQDLGALRGAGDDRDHAVDGRSGGDRGRRGVGAGVLAVDVGAFDLHAQLRAGVGGGGGVGVLGGAGDVGVARAGVTLPLVGVRRALAGPRAGGDGQVRRALGRTGD